VISAQSAVRIATLLFIRSAVQIASAELKHDRTGGRANYQKLTLIDGADRTGRPTRTENEPTRREGLSRWEMGQPEMKKLTDVTDGMSPYTLH